MAIADMPRDLFKSRKSAKKDNVPQSQSTEALDKDSVTSPQASDAASIVTPSVSDRGTTSMLLTGTVHSDSSQHALSDSSSAVMPQSPGLSSPQGSTSQRPSSRNLQEAFSGQRLRSSSPSQFTMDAAVSTGVGVGRIVQTGVKSPMNFCLGLAKGFRNIPKLYNDDTVRPTEKVTDLSTGIRVAGKELGYGFFDGVAGLVTQPYKGAEKEGVAGLVKGFGKGIGGLVAKPAAGELHYQGILISHLTRSRHLGYPGIHHARRSCRGR